MQQPRVGVAVFVIKDDHILIGKRIGSHGAGTLQLPGGHLEFGEEWNECACREVLEETGLDVSAHKMSFFHATNDIFENKHYITIFMKTVVPSSICEPKVMEPQKCEFWKWVNFNEFYNTWKEQTLFAPFTNILSQHDVISKLLTK